MSNDNRNDYISGAVLLAACGAKTREQKLKQAVSVLMQEIDRLHIEHEQQSLKENLDNEEIFCSCADAYRMGHEALK